MKLTFLGAAGTVTGSKYLLECTRESFLVDCGMFQGEKELRTLNWAHPSFNVAGLDAVLLTHAHLDHSGYLPRLMQHGFRGKIYATEPTIELAHLILEDSASIQEEEAERANREHYSKHHPALPFYTLEDVKRVRRSFVEVKEGEWIDITRQLGARFQYNGHIIGSTSIEVDVQGKRIVFSGDVGRRDDLLLFPPKRPQRADILLMETTYGATLHPPMERMLGELEEVIRKTVARQGSVFIPSFAVERAQLLMVLLARLKSEGRIPSVPMIMDSPMGKSVLDLFDHTYDWHKLTREEYMNLRDSFVIVENYDGTLKWRTHGTPVLVIAGSGMLTGGRMLNYLETHASRRDDTLLFAGYQAEGTRGRKLLDGDRDLHFYGTSVHCEMEIRKIDGLSAHADQADLLDWIADLQTEPQNVFLIHGERDEAGAFQKKLREVRNWEATIPGLNQTLEF